MDKMALGPRKVARTQPQESPQNLVMYHFRSLVSPIYFLLIDYKFRNLPGKKGVQYK